MKIVIKMIRMKKLMIGLITILYSGAVLASVSVTESGNLVTLSNEKVSVSIDKNKARVVELVQNGNSILAKGESGYFTFITGKRGEPHNQMRIENSVFNKHMDTEEIVDISLTPKRSEDFPFDMEIHYALREGESGFYFYIKAAKEGNTPDAVFKQIRFAMRMDYSMLNIRLNNERYGVLPSTEDIKNKQGMVMDATFVTPSGDIVTKYEWSSPTGEAPVYGLNNGKQGVWMIRGGSEYLCGGPTKQHNTCHATDKGPVILHLFYSNHYGSNGSYVSNGSMDWEKVFGPTFVYLNQADSSDELWKDAKNQEEVLRNAWPYSWMDHEEYPINRASVTGNFEGVHKGWVVLARPKEFRGLDWQKQGGDSYIYRARINTDGSFTIPAVRDGSYSLYAFAPDIIGEFRKDNVIVDAAKTVKLGNLAWTSRSLGELLWRIGSPDRTAAEFRHGDDFRHWGLWFKYRKEFPDDVDFIIGKSDERKDWNYAQMAVWEEAGGWKPSLDEKKGKGEWKLPDWKIRFSCDEIMYGQATLTIALAGVNRHGKIKVSLNGKSIGILDDFDEGSCINRSGIYGIFQERLIAFDASLLRKGDNVLTLGINPEKRPKSRLNHSPFGIMYDFVQLEVE